MKVTSRDLRFSEVKGNRHTLYIFTILSFFVHILLFAFAFFILNKNRTILISSYVVDLVSSDLPIISPPSSSVSSKGESFSKEDVKDKEVQRSKSATSLKKNIKTQSPIDDQWVSERIAAIRAKKRIEQIAGLRNTISLQAGGSVKKGESKGVSSKGGTLSVDDYYSRITSEIWQHWVYPDLGNKDIETIIVIRILKDGSVQIKDVEKSSGNSLFDRSALRAITKASPLPPPPYETEIGVRFYP